MVQHQLQELHAKRWPDDHVYPKDATHVNKSYFQCDKLIFPDKEHWTANTFFKKNPEFKATFGSWELRVEAGLIWHWREERWVEYSKLGKRGRIRPAPTTELRDNANPKRNLTKGR